MKYFKRTLSIVLSVAILLQMGITPAFAAEATTTTKSKNLTIECEPLSKTSKELYRISNWEQIAASPDLHNIIEEWRAASVPSAPQAQPEPAMVGTP